MFFPVTNSNTSEKSTSAHSTADKEGSAKLQGALAFCCVFTSHCSGGWVGGWRQRKSWGDTKGHRIFDVEIMKIIKNNLLQEYMIYYIKHIYLLITLYIYIYIGKHLNGYEPTNQKGSSKMIQPKRREITICRSGSFAGGLHHWFPTSFRYHIPSGKLTQLSKMAHLQWIYPSKMVIFHSYVSLPEGIIPVLPENAWFFSGSTGAVVGAVKLLVPAGQSRAFPHGKVRDRSPYPDCHPRRRAEASGTVNRIEGVIYQWTKVRKVTGGHWGRCVIYKQKHQQDPTGKIRLDLHEFQHISPVRP